MVRLLGLCVDVLFDDVVAGVGRFIGGFDDFFHAFFLLIVDIFEVIFTEDSVVDELVAEVRDGVAVAFCLGLFGWAVFAGVAHGVASDAPASACGAGGVGFVSGARDG